MSGNQDRRQRRTRNWLRQALLELLSSAPLEQITIRDIADKADVGYTTFFRHYSDRDALLADLIDDEVEKLLDYCVPIIDTNGSLDASIALCAFVHEHRILWTALLTGGASHLIRATFVKQAEEKLSDRPTDLTWLPRALGTRVAVLVQIEILSWWLADRPELSPTEVGLIMDKLLISSLTSGK